MTRSIVLTGTALLLLLAGCSSDDDDSPEQTTNANMPGAPGAANNNPGAANGASSATPSASMPSATPGAGTNEGPNMNVAPPAANGTPNAGGNMPAAGGNMPAAGGNMPAAGGAGGMAMMPDDDTSMSFFVTSTGSGANGGNLGGLDGADAKCEMLAAAVGAGDKTWHAYLSTDTENARDRIGAGPWHNQAGVLIADSVADLHAADTVFNGMPNLILDETGVNAPGAQHDILTGSNSDGTAAMGLNCANWTSNDAALTENPRVGHSDIPGNTMFSPSWNNAHASANCSQAGLTMRGGAGRLYCFAAD
jgi:hypothetical protein